MKNKFGLFAAIMVLACGFIFSGCDWFAEAIECTDKWYNCEYEYSVGSGSVNFDIYMIYVDDDYDEDDFSGLKAKTKGGETIELVKGLNVFAFPDADADSDLLNTILSSFDLDKNFIIKQWAEGSSYTSDNDTDSGTTDSGSILNFEMSAGKWALVYAALKTNSKVDLDSISDAPTMLTKTKYSEFDLSSVNFSWKKLLLGMLEGYL